jgi:predicted nucleic acid-binding protein
MRPYVVVDANVAGAWSFSEVFSAQAQPLLDALAAHRVIMLAPDRFAEEFLRVCQKKTYPSSTGPGVLPADAWDRFLDTVTSPIRLLPTEEYHERAWQLALASGVSTHDALYLAVAEEWAAELWTADDTLAARGALTGVTVRHIRDDRFPY